MEKITLVANLVFLILMIIFDLKMRSDFEELKKKVEKQEENEGWKNTSNQSAELSKAKEEINEIKFRVVALEDKVVSLEYDTKEIREKIGVLSEKIESRKTEKKIHDTKEEKTDKKTEENGKHIIQTVVRPESIPKMSGNEKITGISNIRENLKDVVIFYAQKGMKEEEIAKKLGITYEEVKLILFMMKK